VETVMLNDKKNVKRTNDRLFDTCAN